MNKVLTYIEHPELLSELTLPEVKSFCDDYPYFSLAQMLYAANLLILEKPEAKMQISKAAASLSNRDYFFYYIHSIEELKTERMLAPEKVFLEPVTEVSLFQSKIKDAIIQQLEDSSHTLGKSGDFSPATLVNIDKEYGDELEKREIFFETLELDTSLQNKITPENRRGWYSDRVTNQVLEARGLLNFDYIQKKFPGLSILDRELNTTYSSNFDYELSKEYTVYDVEKVFGHSNDKESNNTQRTQDVIEKFIAENPRISRGFVVPIKEVVDVSAESIKTDENLISDTLANIYLKQGYYSKAISAYQKLSLKYPEKSIYFASQIDKIRKLIIQKL